ncbi:hypothetical protein LOAG_08682 [Loa loa]|uniref:Uncharacterized protein n=1 Tax=Loa loa TaxID=7209 RepID=A0A1S0TTD2_LOALO|nr:hypothetical protein LOAG_08682 [Loa loa]EFO19812.1 hypothetical protein LOAG_08682 [Loa loa]
MEVWKRNGMRKWKRLKSSRMLKSLKRGQQMIDRQGIGKLRDMRAGMRKEAYFIGNFENFEILSSRMVLLPVSLILKITKWSKKQICRRGWKIEENILADEEYNFIPKSANLFHA